MTSQGPGAAARRPLFGFRFCPMADTIASNGRQSLIWFWLTDGWYWLNVGDQELFRYGDAWLASRPDGAGVGPPYAEYVVVRLWEDVLALFPEVLEPIPPDLWERVSTPDRAATWMQAADRWLEATDSDSGDLEHWDAYCAGTGWYDNRRISTIPIEPPPRIWFFRVGDTILIRWDNRDTVDDGVPAWSASVGEIALSVDDFMAEVTSFDHRLINGMRERIDAAIAHWTRMDREIDTTHLLRDHAGRADALRARLAIPLAPTDWDAVRQGLATLGL